MFSYLSKYHNAEMLYDPTAPQINAETFKKQDWTYSTMMEEDCTEVLPPDMPTPHGKSFVIRCFVDADHAGDAVTRKSRTGFIVYLNDKVFQETGERWELDIPGRVHRDEGGYRIYSCVEV